MSDLFGNSVASMLAGATSTVIVVLALIMLLFWLLSLRVWRWRVHCQTWGKSVALWLETWRNIYRVRLALGQPSKVGFEIRIGDQGIKGQHLIKLWVWGLLVVLGKARRSKAVQHD